MDRQNVGQTSRHQTDTALVLVVELAKGVDRKALPTTSWTQRRSGQPPGQCGCEAPEDVMDLSSR